jgi:chromosome segregation ATPase
LEDQARKEANSMTVSRQASSAAEIDNETLRDQVQHLQKQIQSLEDMLEDVQVASEREEAVVRERIKRYKEKEEAMKKELSAGRKEVEQMLKSEATARGRVEENEEALRESTLALENARAEIEVLRSELAVSKSSQWWDLNLMISFEQNLGSLMAGGSARNTPQKLTDSVSRTTSEHSHVIQEIAALKQSLEESRAVQKDLIQERLDLHQALNERSAELDVLKKRINREVPINSGLQEPARNSRSASPQSPKYDLAATRDEITGLKYVLLTVMFLCH